MMNAPDLSVIQQSEPWQAMSQRMGFHKNSRGFSKSHLRSTNPPKACDHISMKIWGQGIIQPPLARESKRES